MAVTEITLVSTNASGNEGNDGSSGPSLSADGRYMAFTSAASDLVAGDTNNKSDVFVKDLETGAVRLVSTAAAGVQGNNVSGGATISADGRYVAFTSYASNLAPGDTTESVNPYQFPNGYTDVFVKDLVTGEVKLVSTGANHDADTASISADGRYVSFQSIASNLVAGDTNGASDVFRKDLQTGEVKLVSSDAAGNGAAYTDFYPSSFGSSMSADGRYVAFESDALDLVAGDTNPGRDVFVKDVDTGAVKLVSTDAAGNQGNGSSGGLSISADGRYVVFQSDASNLVTGDTNGAPDLFWKDLQTGEVKLVATNAAGVQGNGYSFLSSISADGRYVAFTSYASNLVAGGDNNGPDINDLFVKDLMTGAVTRVTNNLGDRLTGTATISADGSYVAFDSFATNVVEGDDNNAYDVFVAPLRFTLDTAPPVPVIENVIKTATGTALSGTSEASSTIKVYDGTQLLGSVAADAAGEWSLATGSLSDTVHRFTASATDLAGNTGGSGLTLYGSTRADGLTGAATDDVLIGNGGRDNLSGGLGDDTFVFSAGFGRDTISDFKAGAESVDVIALASAMFEAVGAPATFDTLMSVTKDTRDGAVITYAADSITLSGVKKAQLHADDFSFF